MEFYILLLVVLLIPLLCEINKEERPLSVVINNKSKIIPKYKNSDIVFYSFLCIFIVIFAFRDFSVGTDTSNYKIIYDNFQLKDFSFEGGLELFYKLIMVVGKLLNLQFTSLLLIVSIIICFIFFKFVKKYSINPFVSIFFFVALGVYSSSFNGMRQFLALAFFILAVDAFIEKKPIKYFIICVIAFLCHSSAIVLFPIYFLRYFKFNWKFVSICSVLTIVVIFLLPNITQFISTFTNKNYYEIYFEKNLFAQSISLYNILYIIGMISVFVFLWILKKNITKEKDKKYYEVFLMLFFIATCVRLIATFSGFFMLVNRFTMYFFWSLIMLLPYSIKYFFVPKLSKIYECLLIVLGLVYFIVSVVLRESNNVYPYKLVFSTFSINWFIVIAILAINVFLIVMCCIKSNNNLRCQKKYDQKS